ncbi:MAG: dipeptidase [Vicinamibacterales bacterium]|nr:dipeptidase [Vicinamibacterales bacterium]
MPMTSRSVAALAAAFMLSLTAACTSAPAPAPEVETEEALVARARGIHERVITMDTHVDINAANFTAASPNYTERLETQVNLPKMEEGGLDAAFFIVYVGQGPLDAGGYAKAYAQAVEKFDAIHRLTTELAPDRIELARTAADVRRIAASGKKVALIGIENGYPIGTDLARVQEFFDRGGRYISLAHNGHSQLADSNTGEQNNEWLHNGLSDLGRQVIAEMNRLGIMVDVSHPSKAAILQMIEISKAPVMASHSSVRALADHSRNMDDELLQAVGKMGGVVQITAFNSYIKTPPPPTAERTAALDALRKEFGITGGGPGALAALSEARRDEFRARMTQLDQEFPPPPRATVSDFVDHIDYAVKLIGLDHVGISSDFDGGGGVVGWNDAAETFNVTLELVRRGYTEAQIGQLWSGNLLRVMEAVERVAREMQAGTE